MRLAVTKPLSSVWLTEQPSHGHRTKDMVIWLPLILDIWQGTLQTQLHSYLKSLDQGWFNALMLLLYLYVKKHNNFVTNKQDFLSYKLTIFIDVCYKFF